MIKSVMREEFFRIISGTWKTFSKCWLLLVLYRETRTVKNGWNKGLQMAERDV